MFTLMGFVREAPEKSIPPIKIYAGCELTRFN